MKNEQNKYIIPNIVLVGYGRTQAYQHKCLKCKSLYFPYDDNAFCDDCRDFSINKLNKYIKEINISEVRYLGNIVGWLVKSTASSKRSNYNYNKVYKRDGFTCQYCEYNPRTHEEFIPLWIDHIIPHSYGGGHSMDNLVVSCQHCNAIAYNKVFNSFEEKKSHILTERVKKKLLVKENLIKLYGIKINV